MHLDMVFHCVNDGLGNSMQRMKDWHEMMENMEISIRKRFMSKKNNTNLFVLIPHFDFPLLKCA
jgi:hypothetical protein